MTLSQLIRDLLREQGPMSRPAIEEVAKDVGYSAGSVAVELHRLKDAGKVAHLSGYRAHSLYGTPDESSDPTAGWVEGT